MCIRDRPGVGPGPGFPGIPAFPGGGFNTPQMPPSFPGGFFPPGPGNWMSNYNPTRGTYQRQGGYASV